MNRRQHILQCIRCMCVIDDAGNLSLGGDEIKSSLNRAKYAECGKYIDALFAKYENRPKGEKKRLVGEGVPYGRMGKPEDLAGMAVFLASDEAEYIVAQTYNVDGGNWMS